MNTVLCFLERLALDAAILANQWITLPCLKLAHWCCEARGGEEA